MTLAAFQDNKCEGHKGQCSTLVHTEKRRNQDRQHISTTTGRSEREEQKKTNSSAIVPAIQRWLSLRKLGVPSFYGHLKPYLCSPLVNLWLPTRIISWCCLAHVRKHDSSSQEPKPQRGPGRQEVSSSIYGTMRPSDKLATSLNLIGAS